MSRSNYKKRSTEDDRTGKQFDRDTEGRHSSSKSNKYSRGKSASKKDVTQKNYPTSSRLNDYTWYFPDQTLAEQASQLSFTNFLGFGSLYGYKVPSIAKILCGLCPGNTESVEYDASYISEPSHTASGVSGFVTKSGKRGVNAMGDKLYTLLSSFTGRTASYGPQDVTMMIIAIAATAEFTEHLRRIIGLSMTYNSRNRTMPLGLIRSMGVNAVDLANNLSIYRMEFNMAISRLNQIPLLENIAFIKKARDIYQFVYTDDLSNMAQIFYYAPEYYYILREERSTLGTVLEAHSLNHDASTSDSFHDLLAYLNQMIDALLESSTMNFIYADLLNMANKLKINTWQFDYLAENYVVMPIYNENASLQFHNLTIIGQPFRYNADADTRTIRTASPISSGSSVTVRVTDGADIYSDVNRNSIVFNPAFGSNDVNDTPNRIPYKWIVDMPTDKPDTIMRIEALRFTSLGSGLRVTGVQLGDATGGKFSLNVCMALPDHYVTRLAIYDNISSERSDDSSGGSFHYFAKNFFANGSTGNDSYYIHGLSQFKNAPLYVITSTDQHTVLAIEGSLEYYTIIDYNYVARLLEAAFLGLFDFKV